MSDRLTKEELEAIAATALQGVEPKDTGHSQRCGCEECKALWANAGRLVEARAALPAMVPRLLVHIRALEADLAEAMCLSRGWETAHEKLHAKTAGLEAERDALLTPPAAREVFRDAVAAIDRFPALIRAQVAQSKEIERMTAERATYRDAMRELLAHADWLNGSLGRGPSLPAERVRYLLAEGE